MTDDSATLRERASQLHSLIYWSSGPCRENVDVIEAYLKQTLLASQSSWAKEKAELESKLLDSQRWASCETDRAETLKDEKAELERQVADLNKAARLEQMARISAQSELNTLRERLVDAHKALAPLNYDPGAGGDECVTEMVVSFGELRHARRALERHASRPVTAKD